MGYVDENLLPDERVVFRSRLHWVVFIPALALMISGLCFAFPASVSRAEGRWIPSTVMLTLAGLLGVNASISRYSAEFALTNRRVIMKVGFLRRSSNELLLQKVESIQVEQGILGRLLDYGTIVVRGTGGTWDPFKTIESPLQFRKHVQLELLRLADPNTPSGEPPSANSASRACPKCGTSVMATKPICARCGTRVYFSRPA